MSRYATSNPIDLDPETGVMKNLLGIKDKMQKNALLQQGSLNCKKPLMGISI